MWRHSPHRQKQPECLRMLAFVALPRTEDPPSRPHTCSSGQTDPRPCDAFAGALIIREDRRPAPSDKIYILWVAGISWLPPQDFRNTRLTCFSGIVFETNFFRPTAVPTYVIASTVPLLEVTLSRNFHCRRPWPPASEEAWSNTQAGIGGRRRRGSLFLAPKLVPIWYLFVPTPG